MAVLSASPTILGRLARPVATARVPMPSWRPTWLCVEPCTVAGATDADVAGADFPESAATIGSSCAAGAWAAFDAEVLPLRAATMGSSPAAAPDACCASGTTNPALLLMRLKFPETLLRYCAVSLGKVLLPACSSSKAVGPML